MVIPKTSIPDMTTSSTVGTNGSKVEEKAGYEAIGAVSTQWFALSRTCYTLIQDTILC